jgi:hypothetical protein
VTVPDLLAMSPGCPDTVEGLRHRAALTVGFYLAARASDLAWLKVDDIVEERKGLTPIPRLAEVHRLDPRVESNWIHPTRSPRRPS